MIPGRGGQGFRRGGNNGGRGDHSDQNQNGSNVNSGRNQASGSGMGQSSNGLNPTRQRGFARQQRIETPTLNDMKAK